MTPDRQRLLSLNPDNWTVTYMIGEVGTWVQHMCAETVFAELRHFSSDMAGCVVHILRGETITTLLSRMTAHECPAGYDPPMTFAEKMMARRAGSAYTEPRREPDGD